MRFKQLQKPQPDRNSLGIKDSARNYAPWECNLRPLEERMHSNNLISLSFTSSADNELFSTMQEDKEIAQKWFGVGTPILSVRLFTIITMVCLALSFTSENLATKGTDYMFP